MAKILKLTIKKKWFDMILSGEKKVEYRNVNSKRYLQMFSKNNYTHIQFYNGGYFSDKLPNFTIECKSITKGVGIESWGAVKEEIYFCLELGKIIILNNTEMKNNKSKLLMSDVVFYTQTTVGREMLEKFREKEKRLSTWLNKFTKEELSSYNAGLSDEKRHFLRKKYNY